MAIYYTGAFLYVARCFFFLFMLPDAFFGDATGGRSVPTCPNDVTAGANDFRARPQLRGSANPPNKTGVREVHLTIFMYETKKN